MNAATAAAERGFAVFPLLPGRKTPPREMTNWEGKACSDIERVTAWWPSPKHNVGIATGPSGLVVIDLDTPKPGKELPQEWQLPGLVDGKDVFCAICEWAGMDFPRDTYIVQTPSLGWHLYFTAPEGSDYRNKEGNTAFGPMIDIRAGGGYVVGAGSVVDGRLYEVLYDQEVQPLPHWIARLLDLTPPEKPFAPRTVSGDGPKSISGLVRTVAESKAGNRTGALVWAAFRLAEMIAGGHATELDGEQLVSAAVAAGIVGGERYARQQVRSVLGRAA